MTRSSAARAAGGSLVLDSEGLSKAVRRDRHVIEWLALARSDDLRVLTSAAILVDVVHPKLNRPALDWTLSRIVVEPLTVEIAQQAIALLTDAGLHGHRHAIDAMLAATALALPGPTTILTSDPGDLTRLVSGRPIAIIKV